MRVPFADLKNEFLRVLLGRGMDPGLAEESARLFAENSRDGIASHGANRFPRVISYIDKGYIDVNARPSVSASLGALEQWDGNLGMGNTNAYFCMSRAMELAKLQGVGVVGLRNTNHWMRGGAYGWQAADAGFIGICWTNTQPNMPPWGGSEKRIGNNPLIFAIPREEGHIVIDAAMSLYSYGSIEASRMAGKTLPFPGGYDESGNVSSDPAAIEKTERLLPIGYWKGSGFAIVLDMIAAALSGGKSTCVLGKLGEDEYGVSQVFFAIDVNRTVSMEWVEQLVNDTVGYIKTSKPVSEDGQIFYPGEREKMTRHDSLTNGVPVEDTVWDKLRAL